VHFKNRKIIFYRLNMSQAHYEAVRLSSERRYTLGSSRRCFLPFRMRRPETSPNMKASHRFSHPNDEFIQQITHEHILGM
jgi:hypothetical protein